MSATSPVIVSRIQNRRGTQAEFDALYPPGYTGVGGATGNRVLQPGEIGLCLDSRRVFIGTLNGEYIEFGKGAGSGSGSGINFDPIIIQLPPTSEFVEIPELTVVATPMLKIMYSVADTNTDLLGAIGTAYSRVGQLDITSTSARATLSDDYTTVDEDVANILDFRADYSNMDQSIRIKYRHDFPGILTMTSGTISWAPF